MSKHTAGPWTCETSLERWGEYFIPQIAADIIAMDDLESDEPVGQNETDEANARLIAAAPQLLATLEWIAQEIRWEHDMMASLAVAEQAIAKATGAE